MRNATRHSFALVPATLLVGALCFVGCSGGSDSNAPSGGGPVAGGSPSGEKLSGAVTIDGSSTVLPISEAIAEEFQAAHSDVQPTVNSSGTGGGFKKFAAGEIDIAGASRPIEEEEVAACKKNGIEFVEIPIAYDGLSLVVNKDNGFIEDITVADLKKIWESGSTVKTWKDVNPAWPAEPMKLYGAGTDSGTFDYFTEAITGKKGNSRTDYQPSEDDNILVKGIQGDKFSLGYFGYGYYEQNKDSLKVLKVGGVVPSQETILNGTYTPLSRPLFWYINAKSLEKPQVKALVDFLLKDGKELIASTGYIQLPEQAYTSGAAIVSGRKLGTRFMGGETGLKIEDVLARESK